MRTKKNCQKSILGRFSVKKKSSPASFIILHQGGGISRVGPRGGGSVGGGVSRWGEGFNHPKTRPPMHDTLCRHAHKCTFTTHHKIHTHDRNTTHVTAPYHRTGTQCGRPHWRTAAARPAGPQGQLAPGRGQRPRAPASVPAFPETPKTLAIEAEPKCPRGVKRKECEPRKRESEGVLD